MVKLQGAFRRAATVISPYSCVYRKLICATGKLPNVRIAHVTYKELWGKGAVVSFRTLVSPFPKHRQHRALRAATVLRRSIDSRLPRPSPTPLQPALAVSDAMSSLAPQFQLLDHRRGIHGPSALGSQASVGIGHCRNADTGGRPMRRVPSCP